MMLEYENTEIEDDIQENAGSMQKKQPERMNFTCACGYKFSVDINHHLEIRCPWCGKLKSNK